jgi:DNA-directed RNA polymerase specialized sigma24 family protein
VSLEAETQAPPYSLDEIRPMLQALTAAQKTALMRLARIYARKTSYGHDDLFQEAYARILGGDRTWPRHVEVVTFFHGVIRSVAWDWRRKGSTEEVVEGTRGSENHPEGARLDIQKVIAIFSDDPIAQKVLLGIGEGLRGEELREISGLTQRDYETIRTKIRRRLDKLER